MSKNFDIANYMEILKKINENYKEFKKNTSDESLYINLKSSIKELDYLLDHGLIPSNLIYKTLRVRDGYYRLMETKHIVVKSK